MKQKLLLICVITQFFELSLAKVYPDECFGDATPKLGY